MNIKEITCKTALSTSSLPGLDYSLNPYRGCQHNCAYCYVPNVLRIPRTQWGRFVEVKKNIPQILAKELKTKKHGVIGISTVTDPYQPVEKTYKTTRYCLEQILQKNFPISIQTKSSLITRDINIITKFSNAEIIMSIATLDDDQRRILETQSSPIIKRLQSLHEYAQIGIKTSVFFGPIYPTIKPEDIPNIIKTFSEYGAQEVIIDKLNIKPGIEQSIEHRLIEHKWKNPTFSKHNLSNEKRYQQIRNITKKIGKQEGIRIIDAF